PSPARLLESDGALASHTQHDPSVRDAVLRHRPPNLGARSVVPGSRCAEPVRGGRFVLSLLRGRESGPDHRGAGAARRGPYQEPRMGPMSARSFSHVGITVSDFSRAVKFYWEIFGCPLVGVADTPPERVRTFFGVDAPSPSCKI